VLAGFGIFVAASLMLAVFIGAAISSPRGFRPDAPACPRPPGRASKRPKCSSPHRTRNPRRHSAHEIDTIIDNIGIPNGGFNLAFGDIPPSGRGDGDILISLKPETTAPPRNTPSKLRKRLHEKFPDVTFFFEAANITNQILNFGCPRPSTCRWSAATRRRQLPDRRGAGRRSRAFPGRRRARPPGGRLSRNRVNVDRSKAGQLGLHAARRHQQPADLAQRPAARWRPTSG
jgi:hypothetical protein